MMYIGVVGSLESWVLVPVLFFLHTTCDLTQVPASLSLNDMGAGGEQLPVYTHLDNSPVW